MKTSFSSQRINNITKDRVSKEVQSKKSLIDSVKSIKDNLSVIVLFFYLVGFVYLKTFYGRFGIKIEYYLSLNDIIFIGLYKIIFIVVLYIIVELFQVFLILLFKGLSKIITGYIPHTVLYKKIFYSYSVIVGIFIVFFMSSAVNYYKISDKIFFIAVLLPYMLFKIMSNTGLQKPKSYNLLLLFTSLAIVIFSYLSAISDSDEIKRNSYNPKLLIYANKKVNNINGVNKALIGETSSNMFIYDKHRKMSIIYDKSDFEKLEIKTEE